MLQFSCRALLVAAVIAAAVASGGAVVVPSATVKIPYYSSLPVLPTVNLRPSVHYGNFSNWLGTVPAASNRSIVKAMQLTMVPVQLQIDDSSLVAASPHVNIIVPSITYTGAPSQLQGAFQAAGSLVGPVAHVASGLTFSLELTNKLPFQPDSTCADPFPGRRVVNGFHDLPWTNLHTHGMRVDPGGVTVADICRDQSAVRGVSTKQYLCDAPTPTNNASQVCRVLGDNIYIGGRPHSRPLGFQSTAAWEYPLARHAPGVTWYHPHIHGSSSYQTPTAKGPMIIAEDTIPSGIKGLYEPLTNNTGRLACIYKCAANTCNCFAAGANRATCVTCTQTCANACPAGCDTLQQLLMEQPNTVSPLLVFEGLWLRNNTLPDGDGNAAPHPDDDTLLFLACNADGGSEMACPSPPPAPDTYSTTTATNKPGRDFVTINSVMQPDISIVAGRYTRMQLLNTQTMKWMNLAVWRLPTANPANPSAPLQFSQPANCSIHLLGKDAVPLASVPRLIQSVGPKMPAGVSSMSDILMFAASRADIMLRCDTPGTYALVSGAGPYDVHPDCAATHCELIGAGARLDGAIPDVANNFYKGKKYNGAVLATVTVTSPVQKRPLAGASAAAWSLLSPTAGAYAVYNSSTAWLWDALVDSTDPVLGAAVCRTRLEQFQYLNTPSFPTKTVDQCYSFNNAEAGAACNVNGCDFGQYQACIDQGTTQRWKLRDVTFHPFHMHDSPIQAKVLPACVSSTNFFQVGDWQDIWHLPICQCTDPPGVLVRKCDEMTGVFVGSEFGTQNSFASAERYSAACQPRFSVFHCHVLSHEDEGCMALLKWACPSQPCPATQLGRCPEAPDEPCRQNVNLLGR